MTEGAPSASNWKRKNSTSGPTIRVYPIFFALSVTRLRQVRGSPSKSVPSGIFTSQTSRATFPRPPSRGKIRNVLRSGWRSMSDSSMRVNPSIEDPSNMISPSKAFWNWLAGNSTFLLAP